jgi:hypothetical protein
VSTWTVIGLVGDCELMIAGVVAGAERMHDKGISDGEWHRWAQSFEAPDAATAERMAVALVENPEEE